MRVLNGKPFRWERHLERLQHGLEFVKIVSPYTASQLRDYVDKLITQNEMPDSLLRLTISRGVGKRGYSPAGADHPSVVLSLHAAAPVQTGNPPRCRLITSGVRLPADEPLARFKTCAKIPQILARAEADAAGANEALLLNNEGFVVEASSSNLFWVESEAICTAPLPSGILPGVTRSVVLELCEKLGLKTKEHNISREQLTAAQGVFLSLSSAGIVEAESLDEKPFSRLEYVKRLSNAYWQLVQTETS
jgi:branched-subunit amino acid aminotransferase/4-amino-4-deoxychorismate lyase